MDPTLFPFAGDSVPFLGGTLGAGGIPQQPAQAPIGAPPSGIIPSLRNMFGGAPGSMQGPAPPISDETLGASQMYPFISQNQNVPNAQGGFGPNPLAAKPEQTETPETATQTSGPLTKEPPGGGGGNKLADALRGVKAPAPPQAQTVRTPPPPQLAPIKGGEFVSMLSSLGITPQEFIKMRMGGLGGR